MSPLQTRPAREIETLPRGIAARDPAAEEAWAKAGIGISD